MAAEFEIQGLDALLAKLDGIKQDAKLKGGRFALRKAANLVAAKAKEGAARLNDPQTSEEIVKNVAVRWNGQRFKNTGDLAFRVGILGGARQYSNTKDNVRKGRAGQTYLTGGDKSNPGGDTFYWRFLEFGTEKAAAKPFMRPALENNIQAATNEFVTEYGKSIDRAIKKAAKT